MIGWIGSICLSLCGLPLAYKTIKEGHAQGISNGFLFLWFIGEIFALLYSLDKDILPLLLNYGANLLFIGVVIFYKIRSYIVCKRALSIANKISKRQRTVLNNLNDPLENISYYEW